MVIPKPKLPDWVKSKKFFAFVVLEALGTYLAVSLEADSVRDILEFWSSFSLWNSGIFAGGNALEHISSALGKKST